MSGLEGLALVALVGIGLAFLGWWTFPPERPCKYCGRPTRHEDDTCDVCWWDQPHGV